MYIHFSKLNFSFFIEISNFCDKSNEIILFYRLIPHCDHNRINENRIDFLLIFVFFFILRFEPSYDTISTWMRSFDSFLLNISVPFASIFNNFQKIRRIIFPISRVNYIREENYTLIRDTQFSPVKALHLTPKALQHENSFRHSFAWREHKRNRKHRVDSFPAKTWTESPFRKGNCATCTR